jgi:hypothetical protein
VGRLDVARRAPGEASGSTWAGATSPPSRGSTWSPQRGQRLDEGRRDVATVDALRRIAAVTHLARSQRINVEVRDAAATCPVFSPIGPASFTRNSSRFASAASRRVGRNNMT